MAVLERKDPSLGQLLKKSQVKNPLLCSCLEESSLDAPGFPGCETKDGNRESLLGWGGVGSGPSTPASWLAVCFTCRDRWLSVPDCLASILPPLRDKRCLVGSKTMAQA